MRMPTPIARSTYNSQRTTSHSTDVSPDNIIMTPGLDAYLTDFGTSTSNGEYFATKAVRSNAEKCPPL